MAGLRIFVSSTCFDMGAHRGQIRSMLERMGYEPVMSDYSDILYDPRGHTHANCVKDVPSSDIMIVLIGSRYGGVAIPDALPLVDLKRVFEQSSTDVKALKEKLSITQLEVMKAIESKIPVFAFVESRVYADHNIYQTNKAKPFVSDIEYPSISKQDSAKYIFEFITFLTHRVTNNGLVAFSDFSEIERHLLKQWSMLFQTLLNEQREKQVEERRTAAVIEQIQDLKAVMLQSISGANAKDVARGVIRYRRLLDILRGMRVVPSAPDPVKFEGSFQEFLDVVGVVDIVPSERAGPFSNLLVLADGTFFGVRLPFRYERYAEDWESWKKLSEDSKKEVLLAVSEAEPSMPIIRYNRENVHTYLEETAERRSSEGQFWPIFGLTRDSKTAPEEKPANAEVASKAPRAKRVLNKPKPKPGADAEPGN